MSKNQPDKSRLLSSSDLIKKYNISAKKSLGQNFIFDKNLTDKIVRCAGELNNSKILEVGPGAATLTLSLLKNNPEKLIVVEKDQRFFSLLEEIKSFYPNQLEIICADALLIDEKKLFGNAPFKIIANLPYNIGTKLLFKWLENYQNIEMMILMLQKEVVERIVARAGNKDYGRLAVMVNFLCATEFLFDVNPACFTPPPKVISSKIGRAHV